MHFNIFAVEMKGFKCYFDEVAFEFPQEPGLYYMTGRNEYNPRLGANGCGKSTIIDAIEWCLYGKTSRGLRAGDIVSWGSKKGSNVSVSLLVGEDEYTITRTQKPNSLEINGKGASQEEVESLIRLNQEAFNTSVILPQFGDSFFDLSPTKKLEVFSRIMNLDYWLDRSKLADTQSKKIKGQIYDLEKDLEFTKGKLEDTRQVISDMVKKREEHDKKVEAEKKAITKELVQAEKKLVSLQKAYRKLTKGTSKVDNDLEEVNEAIKECDGEILKANRLISDKNAMISAHRRQIKEIEVEGIELASLTGDKCPTCLQKVKRGHIEGHVEKLDAKIRRIKSELDELVHAYEEGVKARKQFEKDLTDLNLLKREIQADIQVKADKVRDAKNDVRRAEDKVEGFKHDLKKLKASTNPYDEMIDTRKGLIKKYKAKIKGHKKELIELNEWHQAVSYWVGGFKMVRLFVLKEALTALELEVNNNLEQLGLNGWYISLDVERENKSGNISRGFSVLIHSPKHDNPVKYEAWSGGELQRLRMAGDLGMSNLIMEQAGFVNQFEMIDEPSEHMADEGIRDLIEALHSRAHATERRVWLVDHRSTDFGEFSGVLTAVMKNDGNAAIEYEGNND